MIATWVRVAVATIVRAMKGRRAQQRPDRGCWQAHFAPGERHQTDFARAAAGGLKAVQQSSNVVAGGRAQRD
jgi:hypothetical protein